MLTLKERAEVYRLGLNCGFFNKQEVIQWVDNCISQSQEPEYILIEVSLLQKKKSVEISSKLKELVGMQRPGHAVNVLFGLCYTELLKKRFSDSEICSFLDNIPHSDTMSDEATIKSIDVLTDEYYLAERQIYGSLKSSSANLKDFLAVFEIFADEF